VGKARDLTRKAKLFFSSAEDKTDLPYILGEARPSDSLIEKVIWLEKFLGWIRLGAKTSFSTEFNVSTGQIHTVRIRFVLQVLERNPHWKKSVSTTIRSILKDQSGLQLFSQTGLSQEGGLFGEGIDRLLRKILPAPLHENELSELFSRVFTDENDALWITNIPNETLGQIVALIQYDAPKPKETFLNLQQDIADSLLVLGSKVSSTGLSHEIRSRLPFANITESPFFRLNQKLEKMANLDEPLLFIECQGEIENCRRGIQDVIRQLEESGVSISIVFKLESLSNSLNRIEVLLRLLSPNTVSKRTGDLITRFIAELVRTNLSNMTAVDLIQRNLHLLARKIVERTGTSGEHYITKDRREYKYMLWSAGGGGLMTVITTLIKIVLAKMNLALFFQGFFSWINYAGSFVAMQFLGLTLATKQPSMTAPVLAGKLKHIQDSNEVQGFVEEVTRITRSQFAAALGNIGMVIPGALLFEVIFYNISGHHVVNHEYASHTIDSFHPFKSLTIPQAALTGIILWLASISGGWLENWVVFRQIPEAIAQHRHLMKVIGKKRSRSFSKWFLANISGFGVNISLGFYLAFSPIVGHFFGVPLDVKHITLSTGALTFAVCGIGRGNLDPWSIGFACLGILIIGLLNFGVSFALALAVAMRARNVEPKWLRVLFKHVWAKFKKTPAKFFLPQQ